MPDLVWEVRLGLDKAEDMPLDAVKELLAQEFEAAQRDAFATYEAYRATRERKDDNA